MLFLNEQDIRETLSLNEFMDGIEKAFEVYQNEAFDMPDRFHMQHDEDTYLYMPCHTEKAVGTKCLSLYPGNGKKNLPVIEGIMLLNNPETGKPIAILDGAALTAYRTGAIGGVGIKYTTREDCKSVGLIGTGIQGFYQLLFASEVRNIKKIFIYDLSEAKLKSFKEKLETALPKIEINIAESPESLLENSEIIITATPSKIPVLPDDKELLRGKHIISLGSYKPDMHELPPSLFELVDNVFIDTEFAAEESGDIKTPLEEEWINRNQLILFGDVITGKYKVEKNTKKTTLFKFVGIALFDLFISDLIYKKAVDLKTGQLVLF